MTHRFFTAFVLFHGLLLSVWAATPFAGGSLAPENETEEAQQHKERRDYYKKWIERDVKYIITDDEKEIFKKLTSWEEKEQFIEQFWSRRDPDSRTARNEFKEEHYRRIAYANDHFGSGFPGWMTDRGRVYIIHGPPNEIERHPSGGGYERPIHEGGGATATYPFEVWRYRYIDGIGDDVELEFVDKTWTEEYRLALSADEKDVFLNIPGHGLTKAEQIGLATKFQRTQLRMSGANRELYPLMQHRIKDSAFARYETFAKIKSPTAIKYRDLRDVVKINISYNNFPFKVRQDFLRLNDKKVLVPITLEFENRDLTFELDHGVQRAKIAVYGIVTSLNNRIVTEFEDDMVTSFRPESFEQGLMGRTVYQKILVLPNKMRHKLSLVAKDVAGGNRGVIHSGLIPPSYPNGEMALSSLILADLIRQLPQVPTSEQMFVLGDLKVRPVANGSFPPNGVLGIYLQLYNAALDPSTLTPSLAITYRILRKGETVLELLDENGASMHDYSDQRVVLVKGIPLKAFEAGVYKIEVEVQDRIREERLAVSDDFQISK